MLTDLVMPGITGMEVLERVAEFDPAIDVILMTAHYTSESAVEAIGKGASDYLNKPVSIAALRERIAKLVEEARAAPRPTALATSCWKRAVRGHGRAQRGHVGNVFAHPPRGSALPHAC